MNFSKYSWSYGSWISDYICNQWFRFMARCTLGSLTDKTERHDRTDILLKVALNTISHHHLTYFNKDSCLCLKKIFVFSWCVFFMLKTDSNITNSIIGVMVSVFASNVVYRWFESLSGHRMWYIVGSSPYRVKPMTVRLFFSCFSSKHADLGRKSEDWLARN